MGRNTKIIILFFASVPCLGALWTLGAEEENTSPKSPQAFFKKDIVFFDIGGSANSIQSSRIRLYPSVLFPAALLSVQDVFRKPSTSPPQKQALAYALMEDWNSKTKIQVNNYGYFREEAAINSYISLGILIENNKLILKDVPLQYFLNGDTFNQWMTTTITVYRDGVPLPTPDDSVLLFFETAKQTVKVDVTTTSPELGLHYSTGFLDFYFRIGFPLFKPTGYSGLSVHRTISNLGARFLVSKNITFHVEVHRNRWDLKSQRAPAYHANFTEIGLRFGIGFRK